MNWVGGIYFSVAGVWAVAWGIAAAINHAEWKDHRKGISPKTLARGRKDRSNFLGCMVMLAFSPIWPVPVAMLTVKGIKAVYRETQRAFNEEVAEAIETLKPQDKK